MPSLYQFSEPQMLGFILVLLRVTAFIVALPIFGTSNVPTPVKILLSFALSFIIYPILLTGVLKDFSVGDELYLLALKEVVVGLMLGFVCRMFFFAISIAGQLMSVSMGLSAAQLFNPAMDAQGTSLEQFQMVLATLLFLLLNGHHLFLLGLGESFNALPLSFDSFNFESVKSIALMGQEVLAVGLKLSAPIVISVFITNLSMGVIGRAVPQINVLVTSLHLTIIVGLFVFLMSLPLMVSEMDDLKDLLAGRLWDVIKQL